MKTITTITLDHDVLTEARLKRINISKTCNEFLRTFLNKKEEQEKEYDPLDQTELDKDITDLKIQMEKLSKIKEKRIKKIAEMKKKGKILTDEDDDFKYVTYAPKHDTY